MKDKVVEYWHHFHIKVCGRHPSGLKANELVTVDKFVDTVGESAGDSFLFGYMCYQFYYWSKLDTKIKGIIPISWVVGDKAYSRWKSEDHWRRYSTELSGKYGVLRSDLIQNVPKDVVLHDYEERDKLLYYNTDKGLVFCADYTSGFHPKSHACNYCNNKASCIKITQLSLSSVYNSRMGVSSED